MVDAANNLIIDDIYCIDALDGLKMLDSKSVDLILTDPPYAIGMDKGFNFMVGHAESSDKINVYTDSWDNQRPSKEVFDEILRVGKKVVIFGGNYFLDKLPLDKYQWIIWDKIGNRTWNDTFSDCEMAWTNGDGVRIKKYVVMQKGFVAEEKVRFHPTQKPVKLFRKIISDLTNEGDIVLDCFIGSGTTALAAKQLNRHYIGFDNLQKYVDISKARLNQSLIKDWWEADE